LLTERFRDLWWGEHAEELRRKLHMDYCPTCPSMCYGSRPVSVGEVFTLAIDKLAGLTRIAPDSVLNGNESVTDAV
jgi:hypothetical protein